MDAAKILSLGCLLFLFSCGADTAEIESKNNSLAATETEPKVRDTCLVGASTMAGNRYVNYIDEEQILLRATTPVDWQLEVYDLFDCRMKAAFPLPENFSPDYPYFLADINYNTSQKMVGIRGYKRLFVADLDRGVMLPAIKPQFKNERLTDTESGVILHLEVWEDYLVGVCEDWGTFVFAVDSIFVRPVMPVADLKLEEGGYQSLFLIKNVDGKFQAILPGINNSSGEFSVNPLFAKPVDLLARETVYAEGSQYVRLKKPDGEMIGVNLYTRELLPVIEEIE